MRLLLGSELKPAGGITAPAPAVITGLFSIPNCESTVA